MNDTNTLGTLGLLRPMPATPANGIPVPQGSLLTPRKAGGDKGGEYFIIVVC